MELKTLVRGQPAINGRAHHQGGGRALGGRMHWLAVPTSLIKKGQLSGGDHDQAGEQVPDGFPVWAAGDEHPISGCGVEHGW